MNMKKTLLILAGLLTATAINAVKVNPAAVTITQRDGTTLTVQGHGDEDFCYYVSADGTLLFQEGTDFFVAQVNAEGTLSPTTLLAHEASMRSQAERQAVQSQDRGLFYSRMPELQKANRIKREPMAANSTLFPSTGSPKAVVILVEFSDSTFTLSDPKATFTKYLTAQELFSSETDPEMYNNYGSVLLYFTDMSQSQFTPKFDIYGPVRLNQSLKYYGAGSSSSENMSGLLSDACSAVDDEVDFTQYDSNGDGYIDLVYVIYAGYAQSESGNSTDCIWPKSGTTTVSKQFDGKSIKRYGVSNELAGTPKSSSKHIYGIGVFCHEFCHCLGLPDLYPASGSTAEQLISHNMEYWSLMDAGEYTYNGYRPTAMTAWERERLGWFTIDTLSAAANVTLTPLANGGKAYRILNDNDATGHEYYIVENVQKQGWNKSLFGHGMMVTHVDYDDSQFALGGTRVNGTATHPRMHVLAADGMMVPAYYLGSTIKASSDETVKQWNADFVNKYDGQKFTASLYKAEAAGDMFPGTSSVTQLTDTSAPAYAFNYNGNFNKPITEIQENSETGTVSFKFMGGSDTAIRDIQDDATTDKRIFSIDGIFQGTDFSLLPNGLYIVGGKKMMKR